MTGGAETSAGEVAQLALHSSQGRVALVATVAASAMASLDATVVNVALPHIGEEFDATVSALQWVLTGYLVALASLILLGGALGDRFGRRKVFMIGTVWFAAASLLCGVAPNIEVLIAARVLQGVGGALLTPGSLAILQASFRESDRAAAVGAWSGLGGVAGRDRPIRGRCTRRRTGLALGIPDQHARGRDGTRLRATGNTGDARSVRRSPARLGRSGACRGGPGDEHLGPDRGRTARLDRHRGAGFRRCLGCHPHRICVAHAARSRSAGATSAVPQPHLHSREPADGAALRRARGDLLPRRRTNCKLPPVGPRCRRASRCCPRRF